MHRAWLLVSVFSCLSVGCATGRLTNGVYAKPETSYRIGDVDDSWQPIRLAHNDVAYFSRNSDHSLAVNSTCKEHEDAPLKVLTNHLLMGFTDREVLDQRLQPLDGREALRTRVVAKLDGVPVELLLVVLKKDDCVYDFTYVSPLGHFDEKVASFEHVLSQFSAEQRS
jgi:hypothetical protein